MQREGTGQSTLKEAVDPNIMTGGFSAKLVT